MPEPIEVIITDSQGKVVFGAGEGALSQNQEISGTLTLTLSLFANRVVQEPLQFVRFANHRMIFVTLEAAAPGMFAVSLVKKDVKPGQFVPMTSVFLDLVGRLHTADRLDDNNRATLQTLYEFISMPTDGLLVSPWTSIGFYSTIVFAIGLIYDLGFFDVQKVISRVYFCQPSEIPRLIEEFSPKGILSCFAVEEMPSIGDGKHLVTTNVLNQILQIIGGEGSHWEILGRLFGQDSNAMRVAYALSTERSEALRAAIDQLEAHETDLLIETLNDCVLSPEDSAEIVENAFASKLEELAKRTPLEPQVAPEVEAEHPVEMSAPEVLLEELPPEVPPEELPPEVSEVSSPEISSDELITPKEPEVSLIPPEALVEAEETVYKFESCPIELAYCKGLSYKQVKPISLDRKLHGIVLRIFEKSKDQYEFEVALHPDRSVDIKPTVDDIISRFGAQEGESYPNDLTFSVSSEKGSKVVRGLAWAAITEFLRQMQSKLAPPSDAMLFLNEGSIMLIPPKRRFDPKQLPSQILKIVKEQEIEEGLASNISEQILLDGASVDQSLMEIVIPLKQGAGVAFVPRDSSEEMPEIMLWLLTISEVSGVGFSRW
ncbi:MAG: hypothetical protein ACE5OZ_23730 [Candidatus Heimdallarchaeota archaeon]